MDECFRDWNKRYTWEKLQDRVNDVLEQAGITPVSISTLRADVKFMQSDAGGNAPIRTYHDGHEVYMRYADQDFSILLQPITERELKQLAETVEMLSRFKGLPNYEWLTTTLTELKVRFGLEGTAKDSVAFAHNDLLEGLRWFEPLFEAINKRQVVEVTYHRFGKPERQRVIHPYQLRQYNNRWYLVGKEERLEERFRLVVLPIDRMSDVRIAEGVEFLVESYYQIERHFKNNVGVSVQPEGKVERIRVRAWSYAVDYLMTKPLHETQRILDSGVQEFKGSRVQGSKEIPCKVFEWELMVNEELIQQLLVYADQLEVLEPESLKKKIAERARAILENNEHESYE
jgi:predicted DNA-binding transcriptional regulator YafY